MKKSNFILAILVYALAAEPVLSGKASPQFQKSFSKKCAGVARQLQGLEDVLLNRPLRGRKRIDLLGSLEEDMYEGGADNQLLSDLKELVSSLEEDYVDNTNGILNVRKFRQTVKTFKQRLQSLKQSVGVANKRTIARRTFRPIMKPAAPKP